MNLTPQEQDYLTTLLAKEYEDPNISETNRIIAYKILNELQNEN